MNCDIAFDLLTRGPFPTGDADTDAALERHLAACHDCRRLAEAMRPAVDLWHEVLADDEADALPSYEGRLPVVAGEGAVVVRERPTVARETRPTTPVRTRPTVLALAAVCIAGVMIGAGLVSLQRGQPASGNGARPTAALQLLDDSHADRLVALGTADDCRPTFTVAGTSRGVWQCCSHCHQPNAEPEARPVALAKSCLVCHAEPAPGDHITQTSGPFDWDALGDSAELL